MANGVHPVPGEPLRFRVDSDRRGIAPYFVDLEANDFVGQCDCPNFRMRMQPKVDEGEIARCKHVLRARSFLLDTLIKAIAEAAGPEKKPR